MKVGILTGGGDCPGLNAVIRAVSKSLMSRCGADVYGFEDGFQGLIERRYRRLEYRDVSGILTRGGTILGTSNRANPFNHLPEGGVDVSDEVVEYAHSLGLAGLVAIGGDGTMSIASGLMKKGLKVVGVPKTIDNDLVGTDRTFGFDTAVSIATEAIDRLHSTAQSHRRVMICETMGRYAGWIALHAGVASGSDVILIPEVAYDIEEVVEVCRRRDLGGQRYTIVAIAEGAVAVDGDQVVRETDETSPDPIRLGGVGHVLGEEIKARFEGEVRTTVLGHVQRGGTPTAFDRVLASGFGAYAASMIEEGAFGHMVALQENRLTHVPLDAVANKTRKVPRNSLVLAAALAVGTSFGAENIDERFRGPEKEETIQAQEPVV